jgi:Na+/H+ antiporter NhaD/arsenite permease-like protein
MAGVWRGRGPRAGRGRRAQQQSLYGAERAREGVGLRARQPLERLRQPLFEQLARGPARTLGRVHRARRPPGRTPISGCTWPPGPAVRAGLLCAGLTAAVSLDGAVVLMMPIVLAIGRTAPELLRPLMLGTLGCANAFSLALPQGNPTNLVVMQELGLRPGSYVAHLVLPALAATLVAVGAVALVERGALSGTLAKSVGRRGRLSSAELAAAGSLLLAAAGGVLAPWVGARPWWALCCTAMVTFLACKALRAPAPAVPWRVCARVAALVLAFHALGGHLPFTAPHGSSAAALLAVALSAALASAVANNLPASIAMGTVLSSAPLPAYAALAGLSVGALATPHGSAATMIALERAGEQASAGALAGYLRLWLPAATAATAAAALVLALTS